MILLQQKAINPSGLTAFFITLFYQVFCRKHPAY